MTNLTPIIHSSVTAKAFRTKYCTHMAILCGLWLDVAAASAVTNVFFNASQPAAEVSSNINLVTFISGDYQFTYTADGYWSSYQGGPPTGRYFSVFWPNGVQAQAITAGPLVFVPDIVTILASLYFILGDIDR